MKNNEEIDEDMEGSEDVIIDGQLVASSDEMKEYLVSPEHRMDTVEIELRMARMELEEAEKHMVNDELAEEIRLRWRKRADALAFMLSELTSIKQRMTAEIGGYNDNKTPVEKNLKEVDAAVLVLGEEAAAGDLGADLVVLYQEVGQNIAKFKDAIARYAIRELEVINGVTIETLAEEMRGCFPDMPVFWRRANAMTLLKYLTVMRSTGSNMLALKSSGCPRRVVSYMQASSAVFGKILTDAVDESTDQLEDEARRRAMEGVEEPVFYQGEIVGYVKKYSDELLKMLLRANRQVKYVVNKNVQQPLISVNNTFNLENINIDGLRDKLQTRIEGLIVDAEVGGK